MRGSFGTVGRAIHAVILLPVPILIACRSPAAPDEIVDTSLTVMTYNIFHDYESQNHGIPPWLQRRDAIVEAILGASPDLLGLQEAEEWQITWLLERLPGYAAVARGSLADPRAVGAETVGILYREERFELRESGHFWYSDSPDQPGSYGSDAFGGLDGPRMATWVRLSLRATSDDARAVYLFNTHFVADAGAADPDLARARSAELLVRRIVGRSHPEDFFFVTGDLNMAPEEWPLRYLLGSRCAMPSCPGPQPEPEFRLVDAWASLHPGDGSSGTRCNSVTGRSDRRVDYVLAWDRAPAASAAVASAEIVDPGSTCPSDHRAVVATFVLAAGSAP